MALLVFPAVNSDNINSQVLEINFNSYTRKRGDKVLQVSLDKWLKRIFYHVNANEATMNESQLIAMRSLLSKYSFDPWYADNKVDIYVNQYEFEKAKSDYESAINNIKKDINTRLKSKLNKATRRRLERRKANIEQFEEGINEYYLFGYKYQIPFNTILLDDGICLKTYLNMIDRSKTAVDKFFKGQFTLGNLIRYLRERDITSNLYNLLGHNFFHHKSKKRCDKTINAIIFDNHIYPLTDSVKNRGDRVPKFRNTIISKDMEFESNEEVSKASKYLKDFEKLIVSSGTAVNMSHWNESIIKTKGLAYNSSKNMNFEIDMKQCYFNTMINIANNNEKIPIFTMVDTIEKYNQEKIVDHYLYFLDQAPKYYQNNILHGFEVNYLSSKNTPMNITHYKASSYYIEVGSFRKIIKEIGLTDNKTYRIFNGLLGKLECFPSKMLSISGEISEKELDFINNTTPNGKCISTYREHNKTIINVASNEPFFKYANNINYYNFTVSRANLEILKTIDEINIEPVRVKVDGIVYDRVVDIPNNFKQEQVNTKPYNPISIVINPEFMREQQIQDIKLTFDKLEGYTGMPGSGKTYKIKNEKKDYQFAMTISNICARNMDSESVRADTCYQHLTMADPYRGYLKYGKFEGKKSWVDEFSMIDANMWSFIYLMMIHTDKVYITGDINQIGPITGTKKEDLYKTTFFSVFLSKLQDLGESQRFGKELVSILRSYLGNKKYKVMDSHIPLIDNVTDYQMHLTHTHRVKNHVNRLMMSKLDLKFDISKYEVSIGTRIKPEKTLKKAGIYKGEIWIVREITDKITLISYLDDTRTLEISKKQLEYFEPAYAITIHSCQGLTIKEPYVIHEISKIWNNEKDITYTALSRATNINNIRLADLKDVPKEVKPFNTKIDKIKEFDLDW